MKPRASHQKGKKIYVSRKIGALIIVLFTILVIAVFLFYYWQKVTNREKLASYLPAESTVAFMEFNLSPGRLDARELLQLAGQNVIIGQFIDSAVALVPHQELFQEWYSGKGGLVIMTTANGQDFQPLVFLGRTDDTNTAEWVKSMTLDPKTDAVIDEAYLGQKLISFKSGQNLHMLWTNDYLVIAENREPLETIAQTVANQKPSLRSQPDYNQLSSALPEQNLGFIYLNRSKLLEGLTKNEQFLTGRLSLFKLYFPFLDLLSSEAISLRLEHTGSSDPFLEMRHLSLYNAQLPGLTTGAFPFNEVDYFYSGKLEKLLPEGAVVQAGGANLLDQRNKMQAYFKDSATMNDLLFSGLLSSLEATLSSPGENADLDNNFFPVFQKEYLFYLSNSSGKPSSTDKDLQWGVILDSDSPDNDLLKIKKVILAFGPKLAAEETAKPVPMTLPDGTIGTEIKADLGEPTMQTLNIGGKSVEQIGLAPELKIYLWADGKNGLLVVASSIDDLKEIIANQSESGGDTAVNYNLDKPSEAFFVNFQNLADNYPALKNLEPLQYLKVARKYTAAGLLSTYQLGL